MDIIQADSLQAALVALYGSDTAITDRQPVYGGDINRAYRLELSDGQTVFMKSNAPGRLSMFQTEAQGLALLRKPGAIGVPRPLALGTDTRLGISFLLMEYLPSAPKISGYWETFGRQLAALHMADCAGLAGEFPYGLSFDNYAGSTRQINTPREKWSDFYRDCRLAPQLKLAGVALDGRLRRKADRLLERLDEYLPEPERPSLLHGDLWSGNALCGPDGKAWILDPAVYVGHYEADLAMTELFGGFSPAFYAAYNEVYPIDRGYSDRRELYDLYHLLNHLNLFGESYYYPVARILERYS